jgi:hypothetical protein
MKLIRSVFIFLTFLVINASAQEIIDELFDSFDYSQFDYTWFNDAELTDLSDFSSIYFQANFRESTDFAVGLEFIGGAYGYTIGEAEVSYFEAIAAVGPYWNIKFSDAPWLVPYVGATIGLGYAYETDNVADYLDTYDEQTSPALEEDGILFYYNATVGADVFYYGVGFNFSASFGYHNRLSAGLSFGL